MKIVVGPVKLTPYGSFGDTFGARGEGLKVLVTILTKK